MAESRFMNEMTNGWNPLVAYNQLAHLPPKINLGDKELNENLERCIEALKSLTKEFHSIPNPSIISNVNILKESQASSKIENIITTGDSLYKALLKANFEEEKDPVKKVFNYRTALYESYQHIAKGGFLDRELITHIATTINGFPTEIRQNRSNFIIEGDVRVIDTPPDSADIVNSLLFNLFEYYNDKISEDTHPLIKMAIAHHQFESIHPFMDANGRTGRILNLLYLVKREVIEEPILLTSDVIDRSRNTYEMELLNIRKTNRWEDWINYMLRVVFASAFQTTSKIYEIKKQMNRVNQLLASVGINDNKRSLVIEVIFYKLYFKIKNIRNILTKGESKKMFYILTINKILSKDNINEETIYVNTPMYHLLNASNNIIKVNHSRET